mmetsp:Transcript_19374/g.14044  ORF Transcript_19374/g.14044 Transcript_19374/m.14044 type:complete len:114 (+) Transcript_19374:122-463(+)
MICLVIAKKEINFEDKKIIENALSLWVVSLLKNPGLLEKFYSFSRSEEKAGKYGIKSAEQFLVQALYCHKNFRVRDEISNSFQILSSRIKQAPVRLPLFWALEVLQNNFPKTD